MLYFKIFKLHYFNSHQLDWATNNDYEIDRLYDLEKGFGFGKAAYLVEARDALVFEGDKDLKFSSL